MCLAKPMFRWSRRWNWDGDRIVHDAIVPSSRPVVGHAKGGYDIDVREFLVAERNAVMGRTLRKDVRKFVERAEGGDWELFSSRGPGSFDHRAAMIAAFVGYEIRYVYGGGLDPWQFPDETLAIRGGDCEDRALLIASLLLASGTSSFNVRVALGRLRTWDARGRRREHDHVWVMYKDEGGRWLLVEPTHARTVEGAGAARKSEMPVRAEYLPLWLFNDVHLWAVSGAPGAAAGAADLRRDWSSVHPTFGGAVHKSILNDALTPSVCPPWALDALNRHFTSWLGIGSLTVDDVDAGAYDPRDHFDNAYIVQGWGRVTDRLAQFAAAPPTNLDAFFYAAHGIADFYAHTSYAHFAAQPGQPLALADPADLTTARDPDYGPGGDFDFTSGTFSMNGAVFDGTPAQSAANWSGKVVSGRYAQKSDSQGLMEKFFSVPQELTDAPTFRWRGGLPHHNEIAVDGPAMDKSHVLYAAPRYARQYAMRYDAAVRHIRSEFAARWHP
jgi:hypothetical protein